MDYKPQQQGDVELMQLFIQAGYWKTELNTLNRLRLYLRVVYLSEICTAGGMHLKQHMWNQPTQQESPHQWLAIPKPMPTEWRLWQQALQKLISLSRNLTLALPLGSWHPPSEIRSGWFYHAAENALYHQTKMTKMQHSMYPRRSRAQAFHSDGEAITEFPADSELQIATVSLQGLKLLLMGIGKSQPIKQQGQTTWLTQLEHTALGIEWKLTIKCKGSMENIKEAITSSKAIAVSDGSFQHQSGSCAWIIEGTHSEDRIEGSMLTPGDPGNHSSFQSKAAGVYGALLTVWFLMKETPTDGRVMLACDGRLVLDRLQSKKSINPFAAHVDLLQACKNIQKEWAFNTQFVHVKGHQDNGNPMVLLRKAWLNIETDLLAKS